MNIYDAAHYSLHNRKDLEKTEICGCYYCLKVFNPKDIKNYTDRTDDTAVCPNCDFDCVLPEIDLKLTEENLRKIRKYWLNN